MRNFSKRKRFKSNSIATTHLCSNNITIPWENKVYFDGGEVVVENDGGAARVRWFFSGIARGSKRTSNAETKIDIPPGPRERSQDLGGMSTFFSDGGNPSLESPNFEVWFRAMSRL